MSLTLPGNLQHNQVKKRPHWHIRSSILIKYNKKWPDSSHQPNEVTCYLILLFSMSPDTNVLDAKQGKSLDEWNDQKIKKIRYWQELADRAQSN